jgi:ElaA protein
MEVLIKKFNQLSVNELYEILRARVDIFVVEQNCPYYELDGVDKEAYHFFIYENNQVIAYARSFLSPNHKDTIQIGRVITRVRGKGLGDIIMNKAISESRKIFNLHDIYIEAQVYAIGFYTRFGFKRISEDFLEDNIPHLKMLLK